MPSSTGTEPRRHGFTLIELLTSVAIIGLLAGILLPAMARARDQAHRTMCLSNLKNILNAIHAYAGENDERIPYGPTAPPPSPSNLYPVTGLVTSQLSLADGRPVALGLLLDNHLGNQPSVLFCPGTDQQHDALTELKKVGTRQAISGYFYRHGSNTLSTLRQPRGVWASHITLSRLGRNRKRQPIRALVVDQNFLTGVPLAMFGIVNRTNHEQRWVHAGYADGHAESRANTDGYYTVDVGSFPFDGPNMMLELFERLDAPDARRSAGDKPTGSPSNRDAD